MLWTIVVVCLVFWAFGLLTSYTAGGLLHGLLIVAAALVLLNFIRGRRPAA